MRKFNAVDDRETEMMDIRWKVFEFKYQIPEFEQKRVPHSELALYGEILDAFKRLTCCWHQELLNLPHGSVLRYNNTCYHLTDALPYASPSHYYVL